MRVSMPVWGLALLVPLAAAAGFWLSPGETLVELYPYGLSSRDLDDVTSKLDELGHDYRLGDRGTVLVAPEHKERITAQLSFFHLPRHRLLTNRSRPQEQGWTPRSEGQRAAWDNLVAEGELVQALREVEGVEDAWVMLPAPDSQEGASVMLKLKTSLSSKSLQDVIALVAARGSTTPERITIRDTEGKQLWPS